MNSDFNVCPYSGRFKSVVLIAVAAENSFPKTNLKKISRIGK